MAIKTGRDGSLRFKGKKIAKIRSWSLQLKKDVIETTCISETRRNYIPSLTSGTGSCSVFYDPDDPIAVKLLNSVLSTDPDLNQEIQFVLNPSYKDSRGQWTCNGFVTDVSTSVNVGAAVTAEVTFQISGKIDGRF